MCSAQSRLFTWKQNRCRWLVIHNYQTAQQFGAQLLLKQIPSTYSQAEQESVKQTVLVADLVAV